MIEDKLIPIIEEKFTEAGFEDCYIVDIVVSKNSKVVVYMDCDSGVPIRKCVSVSRRIEHYLDESLVLGEKYTLEVSSPGLDKPLVKRQFKKNIGRELKVKLIEEVIKGKLISVDEEGVVLEVYENKSRNKIDLKFEDILESKVIVKFNKNKK